MTREFRRGRGTVRALLREVAHGHGVGLLVATHDATVAGAADRVLDLHDGVIVSG